VALLVPLAEGTSQEIYLGKQLLKVFIVSRLLSSVVVACSFECTAVAAARLHGLCAEERCHGSWTEAQQAFRLQGNVGDVPSAAPAAPELAPCNKTFADVALRLGLTFAAQALNGSGFAAVVPHPSEGITVLCPTNKAFIRMLGLKGVLPFRQQSACRAKQSAAAGFGLDPLMIV
jgi:hypothetical protein